MMYEELKAQCASRLDFSPAELGLIDDFFQQRVLKKKEYVLQAGEPCTALVFIAQGAIRQFHVKEGSERTCDVSFAGTWVVDFTSFNHGTAAIMNHQALHSTVVNTITRPALMALYKACPRFETFGRLMTERVLERTNAIAMSLASESPEERYLKLFDAEEELFQQVPQKYIANMLGLSPESLSRIRRRLHAKRRY